MNGETRFFNTLRDAIATGTAPRESSSPRTGLVEPGRSDLTGRITNRTVHDQISLIQEFQDNALPLNIKTTVVASHEEAAAVIVELIRAKDPEFSHNKHVIVHDHPDLEALRLWRKFNRESVTIHTSFAPDPEIREKTIASFIGITAPDIGVAESATLVEIGRPGRPRSTSLVPSIHIAVLGRDRLVADLQETYALLKNRSSLDNVVFISGPSKTADIEAHMVYGAHGPKEVHVIIISPSLPGEEILQTPTSDQ